MALDKESPNRQVPLQMAVKVDDSDRSVGSGYTPKKWESDGVVTT